MDMRLDAFAERFADAGYHALAFDYRSFGESTGTPRRIIDMAAQRSDIGAAVKYVRSLPFVDPVRVGLFGTSFGGGRRDLA